MCGSVAVSALLECPYVCYIVLTIGVSLDKVCFTIAETFLKVFFIFAVLYVAACGVKFAQCSFKRIKL